MADHSKPTLTSNYTAFVDEIKGRLEDISKGFDPAKTSPTNVPVDTIRWVSSSNKWQRWNGSAWVDLASTYAISISGSAAKLTTARSIALSGGATGSASFDGSANITINVTALNPSQLSSPVPLDKGGTGAASAAQARTNLGLGTAATRDVTTSPTDVTAGRVLKVGDFGLGGIISNPNLENNSYLARFQPGNLPVNYPAGEYEYGAMLSIAHGYSGSNTEIVFTHHPISKILYRYSRDAPWLEIYHSGNLPDINWNSLTGKPSTFPPSAHTHSWSQITGAPATATRWPTWEEVSGKPSGFMPPTGHGAVGTYAFVTSAALGSASLSWGATVAGSNLRPSKIFILNTSSNANADIPGPGADSPNLAGTWRIMGQGVEKGNQSSYPRAASLAVRIS